MRKSSGGDAGEVDLEREVEEIEVPPLDQRIEECREIAQSELKLPSLRKDPQAVSASEPRQIHPTPHTLARKGVPNVCSQNVRAALFRCAYKTRAKDYGMMRIYVGNLSKQMSDAN